ncbi:MAG: hypothetical protein ABIL58_26570 [Pseudomonadota bacterium]
MPVDTVWIDECLSKRGGHLWIEEIDTVHIAAEYGTPVFVISENQLRRNVRRFQKSFQAGWPDGPVKVLPAAKANWITAVQKILAQEGCGCDIYSEGELAVALSAGFAHDLISVNGVPKAPDHIYRAIKEGCRITIDSMEEVDVIERAARDLDTTAFVRLRLKPVLSDFVKSSDFAAEGLVPTDLAAIVYKGGLMFEHIREIAPRILKMKNVELVGFHQHHGRHNRSTAYWRAQMTAFAHEIGRVSALLGGYQPREIDIGGGFAIPRDPFNAATDYTEPAQLAALHTISTALKAFAPDLRYKVLAPLVNTITMRPNKRRAPTIEQYAAACTGTLRQELPNHGIDTKGLMLQLEPGRAMHGDTGIHLTRVMAIKRISSPVRWNQVIVDSTEFWFTGGRYEHHLHDYLFANKVDAAFEDKADINGRSCYGDRLMPTVPIPSDVAPGDLFAMLDTAAYQEVSMSQFNAMPRPGTLLVTGDVASVIREAEKQEIVFQRDRLPEHL